MRKIIGIGETVLDIIFKQDQPVGAVPGGSVFNSLISLGRAGLSCAFISETGNDRVGRRILSFLKDNGVDASCVYVYPDSKSPITLAFLNDSNDAEYLFYKDHPNDRLEFSYPDVQPDDVVMYGSYFAVNPVIRPQVAAFLEYARQRGALLYYDVNFRASHRNEVMKLTPNILDNLEMADIVRGSTEDFDVMFRMTDPDQVYRSQIAFYTRKFICTCGASPVQLRAENGFRKEYAIPKTPTVSTVGAGDNFNAGLVYGLIRYGITRDAIDRGLTEQQWDDIISCAISFSANVCQHIDNYISPEFGRQMQME
ncbi:MAG: carbohydrate kinase [Prevotella sp.]|nr:carbohydrate kinase [Prevotella sp.]